MGPVTCIREAVTLVFIGAFNPRLYQPRWFGSVGILSEDEATNAELTAIAPDIASFRVGDWLGFEATTDRVQLMTEKVEHALLLRDFATNFFRVVEHTPVMQFGINRSMHFRLPGDQDRMALGVRLASPKEWPSRLIEPLMVSLSMQSKRPDSSGKFQVTVQPSRLDEIAQPYGVFVRTNEHFVFGDDGSTPPLQTILQDEYGPAITFAREVAVDLLKGERHG
jgi:hypothetical protein